LGVLDDILTARPSRNSTVVGSARGTLVWDSLNSNATSFLQTMTVEIKGRRGIISLLGQNHFPEKVREIAIVGGTGEFSLVQGTAKISTFATQPGGLILRMQLFITRLWECY
ncbi:hypothetical protein SELMODRAFT_6948, partial [Selaginella moellendorffii]